MIQIPGNTINDLITRASLDLLGEGKTIQSRAGETVELCDVNLELVSPRHRHLYLKGRKNNIFATMAETFWVLAGEEKLDPVMNFFLKRAPMFSNDGGKTWADAYGPRIYKDNQIPSLVKTFKGEGLNTRKGIIAIYQPDLDTKQSLVGRNLPHDSAIPCNDTLFFWIREGLLNCKLVSRSADLIWGTSNINIFEFTLLQEIILELLRKEFSKPIGLGVYSQSIISFHVYNETIKQAQNIVENFKEQKRGGGNKVHPVQIGKLGQYSVQNFFACIYNCFKNRINKISGPRDNLKNSIEKEFKIWGVPKEKNSLFDYASLVENYILYKNGQDFESDISFISEDLRLAVKHNKFSPEEWK